MQTCRVISLPCRYRLLHHREVQAILARADPMAHLVVLIDANHGGTLVKLPQKLDATTGRLVRVRNPRGSPPDRWAASTRGGEDNGHSSSQTPLTSPGLPQI